MLTSTKSKVLGRTFYRGPSFEKLVNEVEFEKLLRIQVLHIFENKNNSIQMQIFLLLFWHL